ncbi:hypothetical protein ACEQPO_12880 [Bacillus sp. SL00103]
MCPSSSHLLISLKIFVSSLDKDEQVIYTLSVNAEDTKGNRKAGTYSKKAIRTVMFGKCRVF